jgi:hypothetical protein
MAGDGDQVKDNVEFVDFGGSGPRQALGAALRGVDETVAVLVCAIDEKGILHIYHSDMPRAELALIAAKVSGYSLMVANDWEEPE